MTTISKSTREFAAEFRPNLTAQDEGRLKLPNGYKLWGITVPCYQHPVEVDRMTYEREDWSPSCTIYIDDNYVGHEDRHTGELLGYESLDAFKYESADWRHPWRTLGRICQDAEADMKKPWLWESLLRPGAITLLVAPPKMGKTTMVFDMLNAMSLNMGSCLGLSLTAANVLYISEEGDVPLAFKGDDDRLKSGLRTCPYVAFLTSYQAGGDWKGLMDLVTMAVRVMPEQKGFPFHDLLVVIDTLGFFMGLDDENQAGQVRAALRLLVDLTREHKLAVLLIHHTSKGGKRDEQWVAKVQGSTAFAGNVDIVAALDGDYGPSHPRRKLHRIGRFGTPEPLDLIFDQETGYRLPTEEETRTEMDRQEQAILDALEGRDKMPSQRTLASETNMSQSTVHRVLKRMREKGTLPLWD